MHRTIACALKAIPRFFASNRCDAFKTSSNSTFESRFQIVIEIISRTISSIGGSLAREKSNGIEFKGWNLRGRERERVREKEKEEMDS